MKKKNMCVYGYSDDGVERRPIILEIIMNSFVVRWTGQPCKSVEQAYTNLLKYLNKQDLNEKK